MSQISVVTERLHAVLVSALGVCGPLLDEPTLTELMANPNGCIWVKREGHAMTQTAYCLSATQREQIIRLLASRLGTECHRDAPRLSTILPDTGERFQGFLPPVVEAPAFVVRKPARRIIPLEEYVAQQACTPQQAAQLREAVRARTNILVGGATDSGKTTLLNALLQEIAQTGDRVVTIEDTPELQCAAPNRLALYTREGVADMRALVRDTLRCRPDRIIIGEVRGAEALDMLDAWGTGHPGGVSTLHANSAEGMLTRLETLVGFAGISVAVARRLMRQAQPLMVFMERTAAGRRIREMAMLS